MTAPTSEASCVSSSTIRTSFVLWGIVALNPLASTLSPSTAGRSDSALTSNARYTAFSPIAE